MFFVETSITVDFFKKQELQLHLGVLQQHAALIGGQHNAATSCLICHKLFLGAEQVSESFEILKTELTFNFDLFFLS